MQEVNFDIIIIGGGPSGLTAGIYTSRAMLNTLVISGNPPGGQLTTTTEVENFPGFPLGITGPELIDNLKKQVVRFGATCVDENVTSISGDFSNGFSVTTDGGKTYSSRSVIVATGASAKWLGLESETRLRGKGVSACATCDGFFFKGKTVAVVGGGDAAMEEAIFLTKFASKVYVFVRKGREDMKASVIMQERALSNPKIEFIFNSAIEEILGNNQVEGVIVKNLLTSVNKIFKDIEGLFVAIGHKPNTDFLVNFVELDTKGYVKILNGTKSSVEGLFVAGDVADYKYRQAITAAGFGCMAALDAIRFLSEHGIKTNTSTY